MAKQTVHIIQEFTVPAQKVFNFLGNHNRLHEIYDGKFTRIKDSDDTDNVNGTGSIRLVQLPLTSFEESVTKVIPGKQIEYTISKGSLIKDHYGIMRFIDLENGHSKLDYTIDLDSKIPFTAGLIKTILQFALRKGIGKLAKAFEKNSDYA